MGFMLDYGNGKMVFSPLADVYSRYLDDAIIDVASGAFDYGSVLRRVTSDLMHPGTARESVSPEDRQGGSR